MYIQMPIALPPSKSKQFYRENAEEKQKISRAIYY